MNSECLRLVMFLRCLLFQILVPPSSVFILAQSAWGPLALASALCVLRSGGWPLGFPGHPEFSTQALSEPGSCHASDPTRSEV